MLGSFKTKKVIKIEKILSIDNGFRLYLSKLNYSKLQSIKKSCLRVNGLVKLIVDKKVFILFHFLIKLSLISFHTISIPFNGLINTLNSMIKLFLIFIASIPFTKILPNIASNSA